jgi:hypothetical protein
MANYPYTKGLHDLGNGAWAYLQPDGSWGWSNAGLIVDGEETLLVDTLFDFKTTAEMLSKMRAAVITHMAISLPERERSFPRKFAPKRWRNAGRRSWPN